MKTEHQRWLAKPFIFGGVWNLHAAMATKLVSLYSGAHLVDSNPLGIKQFVSSISISFKCECYIVMQMKHMKNHNPDRFKLGTTLSQPKQSMNQEINSYANWLRYPFSSQLIKIWASQLICIFQKLEYLWNKNSYLKIVNSILLQTQTTFSFFKMAQIGKMGISSEQHFNSHPVIFTSNFTCFATKHQHFHGFLCICFEDVF